MGTFLRNPDKANVKAVRNVPEDTFYFTAGEIANFLGVEMNTLWYWGDKGLDARTEYTDDKGRPLYDMRIVYQYQLESSNATQKLAPNVQAQIALNELKATKMHLEIEEKAGELVRKVPALSILQATMTSVRARLLASVNRAVPAGTKALKLKTPSEKAAFEKVIRDVVNEALKQLRSITPDEIEKALESAIEDSKPARGRRAA